MNTGWNPNHFQAKRSLAQIIAKNRVPCKTCGAPALYIASIKGTRTHFCADHREDAVRMLKGQFA